MMLKNGLTHLKNELGGNIMIEFVGLRLKSCSYLMDNDSEHKKAK